MAHASTATRSRPRRRSTVGWSTQRGAGCRPPATRRNTILIGETGAYGFPWKGYGADMSPLDLPARAVLRRAPTTGRCTGRGRAPDQMPRLGPAARRFRAAHPALFDATGWAHHPYDFLHGPGVHLRDPGPRTSRTSGGSSGCSTASAAPTAQAPKLPLYLTEWGYQTNPPDPFAKFASPSQATWLNQGEYLAWTRSARPLVRAVPPVRQRTRSRSTPAGSRAYWSSFQTGLVGPTARSSRAITRSSCRSGSRTPKHGPNVTSGARSAPPTHTGAERGQLMFLPAGSSAWTPLATVTDDQPRGLLRHPRSRSPRPAASGSTIADPTFGNTDQQPGRPGLLTLCGEAHSLGAIAVVGESAAPAGRTSRAYLTAFVDWLACARGGLAERAAVAARRAAGEDLLAAGHVRGDRRPRARLRRHVLRPASRM